MEKPPITVTVLTKNNAHQIRALLESCREFDEVLLYDNGSTDATLEIAMQFPNVSVRQGAFTGFGPTHNIASGLARNDWVLSMDSDEVLLPEMVKEIKSTALHEGCVYSFPRENIYNGRVILWCGWHPDRQYRLYNRKKTRFTDAQVHEQIITDGMQVVKMRSPFRHYSYNSLSDFLSKMQFYSDLFAKQNAGKRKASVWTAIGHSVFTFFKSYIIKRGILGGYEGFVISRYNAQTAFYKYLKLKEANDKLENSAIR